MWHTEKASTGCFHDLIRHDSLTKDEVSKYKDCSGLSRSKDKIQAVLVLDRYVEESRSDGNTQVPDEIRARCAASPLMRCDLFPTLTLETLKNLCSSKTFAKFLPKIHCKASLLEVLSLTQPEVDFILGFNGEMECQTNFQPTLRSDP